MLPATVLLADRTGVPVTQLAYAPISTVPSNTVVTKTDKVITLGIVDGNEDGIVDADDRSRDGAGIVVAGSPQDLPADKDPGMYEHSLRWYRESGDFLPDGTPVGPHEKPLWSFSGGGVGIAAPDHIDRKAQFFFAPYFTPVSATLGLYYALGDGRVKLVQTFSATPFGPSLTPAIAVPIDTYGRVSKPIGLMANGWTLSQIRGGFSMADDAASFQKVVTSEAWKSISFYVLDSNIPDNAGNAVVGKTYWVTREDFTLTEQSTFGRAGLKATVSRALVTDGNHVITPSMMPSIVDNVQHVFNYIHVDPESLLDATMHAKIWIDLTLPIGAFTIPPIPPSAPKWTTHFDLPDAERGLPLSLQLEASLSGTFSKIEGRLPTDVSVDSTGLITGTPSATGTYYFVIRCSNPDFTAYTDRAFSLYIGVRPTWVTSSTLPNTAVDTPPSFAFEASGAVSIQLAPGSVLPPGCAIDGETGAIVGAPASAGNWIFTVRAVSASPSLFSDRTFTWATDGDVYDSF
jgi:hypothetical protein